MFCPQKIIDHYCCCYPAGAVGGVAVSIVATAVSVFITGRVLPLLTKLEVHVSYIYIASSKGSRRPISYARSEYHTQLAKMSFDKILDLTVGVYFYFYTILSEGTSPVIRAIGVSHTACKKYEFRRNLRSHS